ncbi:PilN domain-containing protein [Methylococcus sp. EFPC2]|uniref:PilN domain-containing protein n=1 Tax=Methylococcus sp. EFPC2 TaxID=2812648 RepID=UPI00196798B2|nr:PilN domain-containing protein [Methylococcus sp. EFPC2]QSA96704.1 PilN domain-containing protein [Methylococcus sp. EFPC2]
MLKLDSHIELDYARFFRWWGGELAAILPAPLRASLWPQRARLLLSRRGEQVQVSLSDDNGERPLGLFPLDESAAREREKLYETTPHLDEAELCLRLGQGQSLLRTFKLPAAASENLRQVMAFEMDRLTPFKADQVYYSIQLIERLPDTRQIRVELALTPRAKLDPSLDELASAGWRPERVIADGARANHDLLPEAFRRPRSRLPQRVNIAAAALFALLLLATLALPAWLNYTLEQQLRQEVRQVTKISKEVEDIKAEAEKLAHENGFLLRKKSEEPATLEMLDELSRLIPDQTWLNGLQYRDRKVVIQGQSPAASSLISQIEASPYFKNTNFVSPVTKDVASGQERFQIASEVLGRRASEQAIPPQ